MGLFTRLKRARTYAKRHLPKGAQLAGRLAEHSVSHTLRERLHTSGWRLHHAVRVPSGKQRSEIDFVLTSPDTAFVVELKNWSGSVHLEGERLIQTRNNGATVNHGDVLGKLERKAKLVRDLCPRSSFECQTLLVFYNHHLHLPDELRERPDVLFYHQLHRSIARADTFWEQLLSQVGWSADKREPTDAIASLRRALDGCGTWDTAYLYGGAQHSGDVKRGLAIDGHELLDAAVYKELRFRVGRSLLAAIFREPTRLIEAHARDGSVLRLPFSHGATLAFQAAGQSKPENIPLTSLVRLRLGGASGASDAKSPRLSFSSLKRGSVHDGVVTGTKDFGVFVDFGGPKDGLVYVDALPQGEEPRNFRVGQSVRVKVTKVDTKRKRIQLVLD